MRTYRLNKHLAKVARRITGKRVVVGGDETGPTQTKHTLCIPDTEDRNFYVLHEVGHWLACDRQTRAKEDNLNFGVGDCFSDKVAACPVILPVFLAEERLAGHIQRMLFKPVNNSNMRLGFKSRLWDTNPEVADFFEYFCSFNKPTDHVRALEGEMAKQRVAEATAILGRNARKAVEAALYVSPKTLRRRIGRKFRKERK